MCSKCMCTSYDLIQSAFGDELCEDCWDEYINSDEGLVEYFISICEDENPEEFDADFLCSVVRAWLEYLPKLALTGQRISELNQKAKELNLL